MNIAFTLREMRALKGLIVRDVESRCDDLEQIEYEVTAKVTESLARAHARKSTDAEG
jgi:hypothetical protein